MTINQTMISLYDARRTIDALAAQLEQANATKAANALRGQATQLGNTVLQLEGLFALYQAEFDSAQDGFNQ